MGFFRKKNDPISEKARALNEQIEALESEIKRLSVEAAAPHPRFRSSTLPGHAASEQASSRLARRVLLPPGQLDVPQLRKQMPRCMQKFCRGRVRKVSLQDLHWKAQPYARIWMTTPISMARRSKIGRS